VPKISPTVPIGLSSVLRPRQLHYSAKLTMSLLFASGVQKLASPHKLMTTKSKHSWVMLPSQQM